MNAKQIALTGAVAADVRTAAHDAGYEDETAYLVDLVHRDRAARDALVAMLRDAEAEAGDLSFDGIMATIHERRQSHAA